MNSLSPQRIPTPDSSALSEPTKSDARAFVVGKRAADLLMALPVVIFLLPPLMVFVWAIHACVSRGPLFFRQERCGRNGKTFSILKFRTMTPTETSSSGGDVEARIFRFGNFLRYSKIDEIPQFVNVLKGEMSVVGPRPHHLEDCADFEARVAGYGQRYSVKPGITGLAQIREYAGEFEWDCTDSRVKADLDYIRDQSLWRDIVLIIHTFTTVAWKCQEKLLNRLISIQVGEPDPSVPFESSEDAAIAEVATERDSARKAA